MFLGQKFIHRGLIFLLNIGLFLKCVFQSRLWSRRPGDFDWPEAKTLMVEPEPEIWVPVAQTVRGKSELYYCCNGFWFSTD